MSDKISRTIDHKCPNCGAKIDFIPSLNKWQCKFCDGEFTIEQLQKHKNASTEEVVREETEKEEIQEDNTKYIKYLCKDCGAEIIADEQTSATFCVYCGNTAILKEKLMGKFAPNKIIPFKKEKKDAEKAFENLKKGRPFVPKEFTKPENIEKIRGIYIPFWLYTFKVSGQIDGTAQKVRTWSSGDTHYTETSYYSIFRDGEMIFKMVPVDGSTRFDNDIMNTIEPFNYKDLVDYNHAYLSGFLAEKYDVDKEACMNEAGQRALNTAVNVLLNHDSAIFTSKTVTNNKLSAKQEECQYVLLPVWMVNVKYNDKMYIFAMNGQTGEFIGDIPLDKPKVWMYSIILFLIIFISIILISYLGYIM